LFFHLLRFLETEELGNFMPSMVKIKLMAKVMAHRTKIAAIASGGIRGSKGKEIATLLTYQDAAEKPISVNGTVTQDRNDIVQRVFLSRKPMNPFTKIMLASPITK
jgi:hypothetical protein